jgi:hypothetical protein
MNLNNTHDVIWLALQYAKQDRRGIVEAYGWDKTGDIAVKKAKREIEAFKKMQIKLFGTSKSTLDIDREKMKSVTIRELKKLVNNVDKTIINDGSK